VAIDELSEGVNIFFFIIGGGNNIQRSHGGREGLLSMEVRWGFSPQVTFFVQDEEWFIYI